MGSRSVSSILGTLLLQYNSMTILVQDLGRRCTLSPGHGDTVGGIEQWAMMAAVKVTNMHMPLLVLYSHIDL